MELSILKSLSKSTPRSESVLLLFSNRSILLDFLKKPGTKNTKYMYTEEESQPIRTTTIRDHIDKIYSIGKNADNGAYFTEMKSRYGGEIPRPVSCATRVLQQGFGIPMESHNEIPHHLRQIGFTEMPDLDEHELSLFLEEFGRKILND